VRERRPAVGKEKTTMPRTIQLAASLPAPPERLFDMYLDPIEHADFAGVSHGWERFYWTPWRAHLAP